MSALPYMPLYVADYLADTAHLTALENGAYLMLIMNYWQRGKALPGGKAQLARIARVTTEEWEQIGPAIAPFFEEVDGEWVHNRIERELAKVREKSIKASAAGKASAERKAESTSVVQLSSVRSTSVQRPFNHTDTDTDTKKDNARDAHDSFWEVCPRKVGKGSSKKAWRGAILKTSPETIIAAMRVFASKQAGQDEKYIPHPATWLNQERWQDADLQVNSGQSSNFSSTRDFLQRIGRA